MPPTEYYLVFVLKIIHAVQNIEIIVVDLELKVSAA